MAGDLRVLHDIVVIPVVAGQRFRAIKKRLLSSLVPKTGEQEPMGSETSSSISKLFRPLLTRQIPRCGILINPTIDLRPVSIAGPLDVDPATLKSDVILANGDTQSDAVADIQSKQSNSVNGETQKTRQLRKLLRMR